MGAEERPVSFVPASRLTKDSNRSPTGAATATPSPSRSASRARQPVLVGAGEPGREDRRDHPDRAGPRRSCSATRAARACAGRTSGRRCTRRCRRRTCRRGCRRGSRRRAAGRAAARRGRAPAPIQTTPKIVSAMPSVPGAALQQRDREEHREHAPRTRAGRGSRRPQYAAAMTPDDAEEAGQPHRLDVARTGRTARRGRGSPATASASANQIPPSTMIVDANGDRRDRDDDPRGQLRAAAARLAARARRGAGARGGGGAPAAAPAARAISGPRSAARRALNSASARLERVAVEVRPQLVAEDELGVRRLPQEVVAQALLAARADDEVRVVHLGRVEQRRGSPPRRRRRSARAASTISARPP